MRHSAVCNNILLILAFLCWPVAAVPAETGEDLFELDLEQLLQVHVETLNKRPQKYLHLPAAVQILDREEIERSGATSIPDLLARIPGVFVKQIGNGVVAVAIRNDIKLYSTNLLVLIDGNPFYNQGTSNVAWQILPVAVEDVERIEVIRGDGGTSWGTNSSGGVINIITRPPDSEPLARFSGSGGVHAPFRLHAVTSTGNLRLAAHSQMAQGMGKAPSSYRTGFLSLRYEDSFFGWDSVLSGHVLERSDKDVRGNYTGTLHDGGSRSYDLGLNLSRRLGADLLHLKTFFYEITVDLPSGETNDIKQGLGDFEIRYNHQFTPEHHTQISLDFRQYLSDIPTQPFLEQSSARIDDSLINISVDHESRLPWDMTLNLGLRYEQFSLFSDERDLWSYSVRLGKELSRDSVLWASLNNSYQFPSYLQSNFSGLIWADNNQVFYHKGNPALRPEKNHSFEVGLRKLFGPNVFLDLSGYYGTTRDEIIVDPSLVTTTVSGPWTRVDTYFSNHVESSFWGAELLLGWDITDSLHTDLGVTFFRRDSKPQDGIDRGPVNDQYAPSYKLTCNSRYIYSDRLDFSLFVLYEPAHDFQAATLYAPAEETVSHLRMDGSVQYHFSPQGTFSLGFKNLFNTHPEWGYSFGDSQPADMETSVYLTIQYQW